MAYEDLISLGCTENDIDCTSAPSWIYSTNYWTASASNNRYVLSVPSTGYVINGYCDHPGGYGLRPVITIKKSDF